MTLVIIDYNADSDDVRAISIADPNGRIADMSDIAWGHRLLYEHARKMNQRREWPCPICGAKMEVNHERCSYWVHLYCAQCRISSDSAGSEEGLRKSYEGWATHIRNMIDMGREGSQ